VNLLGTSSSTDLLGDLHFIQMEGNGGWTRQKGHNMLSDGLALMISIRGKSQESLPLVLTFIRRLSPDFSLLLRREGPYLMCIERLGQA
jgi:hypothetical protein